MEVGGSDAAKAATVVELVGGWTRGGHQSAYDRHNHTAPMTGQSRAATSSVGHSATSASCFRLISCPAIFHSLKTRSRGLNQLSRAVSSTSPQVFGLSSLTPSSVCIRTPQGLRLPGFLHRAGTIRCVLRHPFWFYPVLRVRVRFPFPVLFS